MKVARGDSNGCYSKQQNNRVTVIVLSEMAHATISLSFSPGPLGFELEPVWQADGQAIGCRVAGFLSLPDGTLGQAERLGAARPGDRLMEVNGVLVKDFSFDKVISLLQHDTNRSDRKLTFRSAAVVEAPMSPAPRTSSPVPEDAARHANSSDTSSWGGTLPTTPPPEPHPRPNHDDGDARGTSVVDNKEEMAPAGRLGWAMSFLGVGERGHDVRVALDKERLGAVDSAGGAKAVSVATESVEENVRDDGADVTIFAARKSSHGTAADPGGEREAVGEEELQRSRGFAPLFPGGTRGTSAHDGQSGTETQHSFVVAPKTDCCSSPTLNRPEQALSPLKVPSGSVGGDHFCQEEVSQENRPPVVAIVQTGTPATLSQASSAEVTTTCASEHSQRQLSPTVVAGSHTYPSALRQTFADKHESWCRQSEGTPRTPPAGRIVVFGDVGPTVALTTQRPTSGSQADRDVFGDAEGQLQRGSPGAADQSLDTVSLLSEPVAAAKEAKQRRWVVSDLWSGGGQVGGGNDAPAQGDGESEVEEARRLARSLAAKLRERARRCEELENLCRLRDDQVSRLQRQSNSLVGHAACLSEDLSDRTALADALQRERSRLEQELGQANGETQATEFSTPNEDGLTGADGRSAPSVPLPGANTVDAVNGEKVAAGAPDSAETVAISTAAAIEAVETKASGAVAAAEARSLALEEMVDSLLSEKVEWEEEREARATEAMRLRARARGLEDTIVCRGMREGGGGRTTGPAHETIVQGLRKLLLERTRDVEEMHVSTERLAARVRELAGETQRLNVSLLAREGDILASDKEMQALSMRFKGELRESGEATAAAEAQVLELKRALAAMMSSDTDENSGTTDGNIDRLLADKVAWPEERARLHHNLLSLKIALEDRETRAVKENEASSTLLKTARDDCDRLARDAASLRQAADSFRVELAETLTAAAKSERGSDAGGTADPAEVLGSHGSVSGGAEGDMRERGVGSAADGVAGERGTQPDCVSLKEEVSTVEGSGTVGHGQKKGGIQEAGAEGNNVVRGAADRDRRVASEMGQPGERNAGSENRCVDFGCGGSAASAGDRWLDAGNEGSLDDLQLDLMEKDIVIEQLRTQLKQLRSRIAEMEEEQAVDTAPLEGLLTQLGELKGTVEEREEREQQCREQVDLGLMRMERLKEESASAAASPPVSFAGSAGVTPPPLRQADPPHAQVELQRLRRQMEDLQWDLRTLKRRIGEREAQLRDARSEADSLKKRSRDAERDLAAAQGEAAVAATEAAAQQRRASARRSEVQSLRAEIQSVRDRAASGAEETRSRFETDARYRVSAAVAAAEVDAKDRAAVLTASLKAATTERDELLEERGTAVSGQVEDAAARARELETLHCAQAARDVELEAIVEATSEFSRDEIGRGDNGGGGGGALRGALAAATEARRAGRLTAELKDECSSLRAKGEEGRADVSRLRLAFEEAKAAEEKAVAVAATATTVAAASTAAAERWREASTLEPADERGDSGLEVAATKDALQRALAGAERAWRTVTSCLADERRTDEVFVGREVPPPPASIPATWQPSSDAELDALVVATEALASAHRRRGYALQRAKVAVRAKTACMREARRRETAEARAREDAEERLEDALTALHECRRHKHRDDWATGGGGTQGGEGCGDGRGRSFLSPEQEEHLRQMRGEVDRLEGQNRTLRQSLVGGYRVNERAIGRGKDESVPAQRLLFPQVIGGADDGPSDAGWDRARGMSASESASAGTPSSARSWAAAASKVHGIPWPHQGGAQEGSEVGDARARVLDGCTSCCPPPQDDGSGGTLVAGWVTDAC